MKKILAIMLIAVIAVAGVFAVDSKNAQGPNTIQLDYEVKEIFLPAYGFLYGSGSTFSNDDATYEISDGKNNEPTVATDNGIKASSVAIMLYDLSYSNLPAGTTYTMTVTIDPTATKWTSPASDGNYTSNTSTFTIASDDSTITINSNKGSDTVTYSPGVVDHTGTNQSLMGTFEISWLADTKAPAGKYTADIAVTCETN